MITNDIRFNHIKARKPKKTTLEIFIFNITIYLMTVLMTVKIATIRARKAQIPDSGWFLRKNSTNRA